MAIISPYELATANLLVDATYQGSRRGNTGDDPLGPLLQVSNSGGFRYRGSIDRLSMVVLTTSMNDPDWPDALDPETGIFTYFGDNKQPGRALHDTPRRGNDLLRRVFDLAHGSFEERGQIPPIFIFANAGEWRDVQFIGLAVPGAEGIRPTEDLVALWKLKHGRRFQNYRANFTVLDAGVISRTWLDSIIAGIPENSEAPAVWQQWIATGTYRPLISERSIEYRTRAEQTPVDDIGKRIIAAIHSYFADNPHGFERCAAAIARLALPNIAELNVTRPSRDGGRDAIGKVRLGSGAGAILIDFALEAKCYGPSNSVGVRELSRLISRLRHRQFGVLVTTSFVDLQAYREIKEDKHPILIISAVDIVNILRQQGRASPQQTTAWLTNEFPESQATIDYSAASGRASSAQS